jgi:protease I
MTTGEQPRAVVLVEDMYEDLELQYPRLRLIEAGYSVSLAGPEKGSVYTSKHGYPQVADSTFNEITAREVQVLIVPGGYAPDKLRRYPKCLQLVRAVHEHGGVIGFICHGGWVPISAGIVKGKRVTSVSAIRDDLVNAGAEWVDEPCVVDGNIVTAQIPKDLPAFMQAILTAAGGLG